VVADPLAQSSAAAAALEATSPADPHPNSGRRKRAAQPRRPRQRRLAPVLVPFGRRWPRRRLLIAAIDTRGRPVGWNPPPFGSPSTLRPPSFSFLAHSPSVQLSALPVPCLRRHCRCRRAWQPRGPALQRPNTSPTNTAAPQQKYSSPIAFSSHTLAVLPLFLSEKTHETYSTTFIAIDRFGATFNCALDSTGNYAPSRSIECQNRFLMRSRTLPRSISLPLAPLVRTIASSHT